MYKVDMQTRRRSKNPGCSEGLRRRQVVVADKED
jgi:hypothetical protein